MILVKMFSARLYVCTIFALSSVNTEQFNYFSPCSPKCAQIKQFSTIEEQSSIDCFCWTNECAECIISRKNWIRPLQENCFRCCLNSNNPQQNCATSCNCTLIFSTVHKTSEKTPSQLQLLCTDADEQSPILYFKWMASRHQVKGFTKTGENSSGVYIIQLREQMNNKTNPWSFLKQDSINTFSFGFRVKLLQFSHWYQLRVVTVTETESLLTLTVSDWIQTFQGKVNPSAPRNVTVYNFSQSDNTGISAYVSWKLPPERSCYYDMFWYSALIDSVENRRINLITTIFPYHLDNLHYNTNYTVDVFSINSDRSYESDKTATWFHTPTCLTVRDNNYNVCAPDPPQNIQISHLSPKQTLIRWNPPVFASISNPILKYHVTILKHLNFNDGAKIKIYNRSISVPQNYTSAVFSKLDKDSSYDVYVVAVSLGGTSQSGFGTFNIPAVEKSTYFVQSPISLGVLFGGIVVLLLVMLAVCAIVQYRRRQRMKNIITERQRCFEEHEQDVPLANEMSIAAFKRIVPLQKDKFELDLDAFLIGEVIGQGAFGVVHKAQIIRSMTPLIKQHVAIKMLKPHATEDDQLQLLQEIDILKNVGLDPHVISLIACCTTGPTVCLAVEYCAQGDLQTYLRKLREEYLTVVNSPSDSGLGCNSKIRRIKYAQIVTDTNSSSKLSTHSYANVHDYVNGDAVDFLEVNHVKITPANLISYARQIAKGMEYLSLNKFVHRDLAARNILLTSKNLIKISDFGLTRDVYERNVYRKTTTGKLPIKWMAMESIFSQLYTTKSDVWSFGVVLWEITTLGGTPYPGISNAELLNYLKKGHRMQKPDNCSGEVYQLMTSCWLPSPNQRPAFSQLKIRLENMLEHNTQYMTFDLNGDAEWYKMDNENEEKCENEPEHDSAFVDRRESVKTVDETSPN